MNYRVVIDAGHGGEDPGAVGNGIVEKDLTLAISKYMYDRLKELGVPVILTRSGDETLSPSERIKEITEYGSDPNTLVISNHINAGGADVLFPIVNKNVITYYLYRHI